MFSSVGTIEVFSNPTKMWLKIDSEIHRFYRSLIPFHVNKPRYHPHISIVRKSPIDINILLPHHGKQLEFHYSHYIYNDELYFWLECICPALEEIRCQIGLMPTEKSITYSPDERHAWHTTIANIK